MRIPKLAIIVIVCSLIFVFALHGLMNESLKIPGSGTVKKLGVEAYWDPELTNVVDLIDWGLIGADDVIDKLVYIENNGNIDAYLYLGTENWQPMNASNYFALTWDYSGQTMKPDDVLPITFTLTASSNLTQDLGIEQFTFDTVISATEI